MAATGRWEQGTAGGEAWAGRAAAAAYHRRRWARGLLGFLEDRFCAWLITLGIPADRPLRPIVRPNRRRFEDVVHRGHW
jgi:hypothetical protein